MSFLSTLFLASAVPFNLIEDNMQCVSSVCLRCVFGVYPRCVPSVCILGVYPPCVISRVDDEGKSRPWRRIRFFPSPAYVWNE